MRTLRIGAAAGGFAVVAAILLDYPFAQWPLGGAVALYAALLWRYPHAFLVVLPVVCPALDLGFWTGRLMIDEADLFVLTSVSVLLLRDQPEGGLTGAGRNAFLAFAIAWTTALLIGLVSPLDAPLSSNPLLRPENALRIGKSFLEAAALLPFILRRQRLHQDAASLFAKGAALGLIAVTLIVAAEKLLFSGLLEVNADYRVVGPFSSMRLGGGHIGAYAALVLPFAVSVAARRSGRSWPVAAVAALGGGYVLAASLARTAFAAALVGMVPFLVRRVRPVPVTLLIVATASALGLTGLGDRFRTVGSDLQTRETNWRSGLAIRDSGVLPAVFGMGLGTYPRAMLVRGDGDRPTNMLIGAGGLVVLDVSTPFYLGQKIPLPLGGADVSLQARAAGAPNELGILICDKVLLYSDNCRGQGVKVGTEAWQDIRLHLQADGLGGTALLGLLRRPVEFSVFGRPGRIEIRNLNLTDEQGSLLVNGDFHAGLDRWVFTDDSHLPWRMKNQYLMLFFEAGAAGLGTFLWLCTVSMLTAGRGGGAMAPALVGSVSAFLVSCLFDNLFEAPRLGLLFFMICGLSLESGAHDLTARRR